MSDPVENKQAEEKHEDPPAEQDSPSKPEADQDQPAKAGAEQNPAAKPEADQDPPAKTEADQGLPATQTPEPGPSPIKGPAHARSWMVRCPRCGKAFKTKNKAVLNFHKCKPGSVSPKEKTI